MLWDDRDGGGGRNSIQSNQEALCPEAGAPSLQMHRPVCDYTVASCGAHEVMTPGRGRDKGARTWVYKGAPASGMWDLGLRSKKVELQA